MVSSIQHANVPHDNFFPHHWTESGRGLRWRIANRIAVL